MELLLNNKGLKKSPAFSGVITVVGIIIIVIIIVVITATITFLKINMHYSSSLLRKQGV